MKTLVVIPARYASTRFPGKPLAMLSGKPMIQHVYERCKQAAGIHRVIVATEDQRILDACAAFGAEAEMTSPDHASGTDRVAEVAARHTEFDFVLNVQGDEPAIEPETVAAVAHALLESVVHISSAKTEFTEGEDPKNPNAVKVVTAPNGDALYFSRSMIPFVRDPENAARVTYYRHLGIYGFQHSVLMKLTKLRPSTLEIAESLEQLRWLEAGYRLRCVLVRSKSIGVDTQQDLDTVANTILSS
jgi:3-deoxy-manno-octulosonate cytidylyltransferase (CMP-KDO synthetase)